MIRAIWNGALEEAAAMRMRLMEAGLLPRHKDYVRFVVVSNIRSGSTMLTNLLNQHPNALAFHELFHIHRASVPFQAVGYRRRSRDDSVMVLRDRDPAGFLDQHVWGDQPRSVKAVGFKLLHTQARSSLMWWHAPEYAHWWSHVDNGVHEIWSIARSDLWGTLVADASLRIILLRRDNLLSLLVSAEMAKKTGRWGDGATGGYASSTGTRVKLATNTLLRDFDAARRQHAEARDLFCSHPMLELIYEDLIRDPDTTGRTIQDFLGLPRRRLLANTRKQQTGHYRDAVMNWDEVTATLTGTPWEHFLYE